VKVRTSLTQLVAQFQTYLETSTNVSPATWKRYVYELTHITVSVGDRPFNRLSPEDILTWHQDLVTSGLGAASVKQKHAALARFLKYVDLFLRADNARDLRNALEQVTAPRDEQPRHPSYALDPSQIQRILEAVSGPFKKDCRNRAIVHLLYDTGMRRAEIASRTIEDLDIKYRTVHVLGKGNKERTVVFSSECGEDLKTWLKARHAMGLPERSGPLFVTILGRSMGGAAIYRIVRDGGRRAGLKNDVWTHIMRYSRITHSLAGGQPIQDVAKLAGHTKLETTMGYTHPDTAQLRKSYDKATGKPGPSDS